MYLHTHVESKTLKFLCHQSLWILGMISAYTTSYFPHMYVLPACSNILPVTHWCMKWAFLYRKSCTVMSLGDSPLFHWPPCLSLNHVNLLHSCASILIATWGLFFSINIRIDLSIFLKNIAEILIEISMNVKNFKENCRLYSNMFFHQHLE